MKIYDTKQGSDEWLRLRAGVLTASELSNLITPAMEPRKWSTEMPNTYLARKLAEKWMGLPLEGKFNGGALEQGKILEHEAIPDYEFDFNVTLRRPGFCLRDDGLMGCSPDAMRSEPSVIGLECKAPEPQTHCKYLIDGDVPKDYVTQVYGSMFVCDAAEWEFMSYRRGFPRLLLTVARDSAVMLRILEVAEEFKKRLDVAYDRLVNLNGGPPASFDVEEHIMAGVEPDEEF